MRGVSLCTSTGGGNYRDEQLEMGEGGPGVFVGGCVEERLCSEAEGPNFDQN